jgi:hypothetical protein
MELLPALPDAAVPVKQLVRREKGVSYYNVLSLQLEELPGGEQILLKQIGL